MLASLEGRIQRVSSKNQIQKLNFREKDCSKILKSDLGFYISYFFFCNLFNYFFIFI